MKIAESNDVQIHLLANDHTLIIVEPTAVYFHCTYCGDLKSVHVLTEEQKSMDGLRLCQCNAPRSGGDTKPVPEHEKPDIASIAEEVAKSIRTSELSMPTFRFIDRGTHGI